MQRTLDLSIKKRELGTIDGGYVVKDGRRYGSYMDNQKWKEFKSEMRQFSRDAYEKYGAGAGGELRDNGKTPPKMASYGSSSRMIYNLCREIKGFSFEYKLHTKVGGTAHLDGFLEKDDELIFVEAKCREPYGTKPNSVSDKFELLYKYLDEAPDCNLNVQIKKADSKMSAVFSCGETKITSFDIKQMICHLLGIAVKLLEEPTSKKISFLYLCYNPNLIDIIDEEKGKSIRSVYNLMCKECESVEFEKLWACIVRYLKNELNVGRATDDEISCMLANFSFTLCDQEDYRKYL